jgi:hypothetical protein
MTALIVLGYELWQGQHELGLRLQRIRAGYLNAVSPRQTTFYLIHALRNVSAFMGIELLSIVVMCSAGDLI